MMRAARRRPTRLTAYRASPPARRFHALPLALTTFVIALVTGVASSPAAQLSSAQPSSVLTPRAARPLATAAAFLDVPPGSAFFTEIQWLYGRGVTTGWPVPGGREYRPLSNVSREAMAAFMYRLAVSPAYRVPIRSPFRDVTPASAFYKEICWLASMGISTGWILPDSREFRPLQPVSREAMAAFLYRLADSPAQVATQTFVDVPLSSAFATEISWLSAAGISTGWPTAAGREYRPLANVSREAMAAFMYRLAASGRPLATRSPVISAWLPYWTPSASLTSVTRSLEVMDDVSPFWHDATCGSIRSSAPANAAQVSALGKPVYPTVTALTLTPAAFLTCVSNPSSREALVTALVGLGQRYAGVDFDFEHLALTTDPAVAVRVRAAFSSLVAQTCDRLHRIARGCLVTVMPRTSEVYAVWHGKLIPAVYDYAALSRVADRLRIMAYDQHTPATAPGPIGGYDWTEQILTYTAGQVTTMAKVQLGIPAYGRRWGGGTSTVAQRDAVALAGARRATIRFDPVSRERYFSYDGGRVAVWYPSVEGSAEKAALARRYGCQGVVVWAAGMETNGLFEALSH